MDPSKLVESATKLAGDADKLAVQAADLAKGATEMVAASTHGAGDPFVFLFTVFVLAIFVGYYVVWSVTPALHSPLMAVTNAISSVIIVGALIAAGPADWSTAKAFGFIAVVLASINIFGGFIVSHRMLSMFSRKKN